MLDNSECWQKLAKAKKEAEERDKEIEELKSYIRRDIELEAMLEKVKVIHGIQLKKWKQWAEKLEMDIQYYLFLAQTPSEHKSCDSCNEMFKETLSNFQKFKKSKDK